MSELPKPETRDDAKLILDLLLEEYRALRAEIITHIETQAQLLTYSGAAIALLIGLGAGQWKLAIAIVALLVLGTYFYVVKAVALVALSEHIAMLENRINQLVKVAVGENSPILSWENGHGIVFNPLSPVHWILRAKGQIFRRAVSRSRAGSGPR